MVEIVMLIHTLGTVYWDFHLTEPVFSYTLLNIHDGRNLLQLKREFTYNIYNEFQAILKFFSVTYSQIKNFIQIQQQCKAFCIYFTQHNLSLNWAQIQLARATYQCEKQGKELGYYIICLYAMNDGHYYSVNYTHIIHGCLTPWIGLPDHYNCQSLHNVSVSVVFCGSAYS